MLAVLDQRDPQMAEQIYQLQQAAAGLNPTAPYCQKPVCLL